MLARHVGEELRRCEFVGVLFAGSMSELPHIDARSIVVNDKHRHLMNLASVAADPVLGPSLYRKLRRAAYHPDELSAAQARCRLMEPTSTGASLFGGSSTDAPAMRDLQWAYDYFVSAWMIRHATAGTRGEFNGGIAMRYDAGGGDNAVHFRNAIGSLVKWRREVLWRCNFTTLDFREFLTRCCKDKPGHGYYSDSPFPDAGDGYKHSFNDGDHRDLAQMLSRYTQARIVCRFYDHPLIRELYPSNRWTWLMRSGRTQTNAGAPEVLLLNGPSYAAGAA
jgi:DNA adenine methylase